MTLTADEALLITLAMPAYIEKLEKISTDPRKRISKDERAELKKMIEGSKSALAKMEYAHLYTRSESVKDENSNTNDSGN